MILNYTSLFIETSGPHWLTAEKTKLLIESWTLIRVCMSLKDAVSIMKNVTYMFLAKSKWRLENTPSVGKDFVQSLGVWIKLISSSSLLIPPK